MALGLTLIFGVMRMVSFAHGEFYMLGSFAFTITALRLSNLPPPIALLSAPLAAFLVGWFAHRLLLGAPPVFSRFKYQEYMLIMTFGLSITLQNAAVILAAGGFFRPPSLVEGHPA